MDATKGTAFDREALKRVPLAQSVLMALAFVFEEAFLSRVFEQHRGRCYDNLISFPTMVQLIQDALLVYRGSGRKAFEFAHEAETLEATSQAAYGKLRRLPLAVSQALLSEGTSRLRELFPDEIDSPLPPGLIDWHVVAIDGKKIKKLAKRLKPARGVEGKVPGGKTLVARDLHLGLAVAMESHEDGETNDGPLVPGLLEQLQTIYDDEPTLLIFDSQFCDLTTPRRVLDAGYHFLVRYHPKVEFHADPKARAVTGRDDRGRAYREETGFLGSPKNPPHKRIPVRRITVTRPGQEDLVLIASVLDAAACSAVDLLTAYAARWTIETMFQHVTQVFSLERLIGSTAKASVFQCAFCLLLYNIIHLIRIHLAQQHDVQVDDVSVQNVFDDTQEQLIALRVMLPLSVVVNLFAGSLTASAARRGIQTALKSEWKPRWRKAPKNRRNLPPPRRQVRGGHTSIYRLIHASDP